MDKVKEFSGIYGQEAQECPSHVGVPVALSAEYVFPRRGQSLKKI